VTDVIVLLPGITGSVLQKDGKDVWALTVGAAVRGLLSLGRSVRDLELHGDDRDADLCRARHKSASGSPFSRSMADTQRATDARR